MTQDTNYGEIKITLGASDTRYLNMDTNNYSLGDTIVQLYDSTVDGITLHAKELKVEKVDGTNMTISGLIFEIWGTDKVGTNSIKVMQKWSRINASTAVNTPVSNSYRFSISGLGKTGQDALPVIHSGWCLGAGNVDTVWETGVLRNEIASAGYIFNDGLYPIVQNLSLMAQNPTIYGTLTSRIRPEMIQKQNNGSDTTASWLKLTAQLKRVI
jgi:hypothetical protein